MAGKKEETFVIRIHDCQNSTWQGTVKKLKEEYGVSISMQNLDFKEEDAALDSALGGQYNNSGQVHQELVKSTLENGYPETTSGISLETLFNDGTEADNFFIKKTCTCLLTAARLLVAAGGTRLQE